MARGPTHPPSSPSNNKSSITISDPLHKPAQSSNNKPKKVEHELDATGHRRKGDGFLASTTDLVMPEAQFALGCTLLLAAARGDIDMVKRLLDSGNNGNNGKEEDMAVSSHGTTITSTEEDDDEEEEQSDGPSNVVTSIPAPAPPQPRLKPPTVTVNFRDYDRRTALHVAASEGHLPLVRYLVEHCGALLNRSDRWGGSPLDDAHRHRHAEVAAYLRAHGAKAGSSDLSTNVLLAALDGDEDEVTVLMDRFGVKPEEAVDYDGRTALHHAAARGHTAVVKVLLERGADVNGKDRLGVRPIDDAERLGEKGKACVELLHKYGAKRGSTSIRGSQVLAVEDDESGTAPGDSTTAMVQDPDLTIDFHELDMIERIGQGAFGEIYKCRWRGTLVAAKCIKSAKIAVEWGKARRNAVEAAAVLQKKQMGGGAQQRGKIFDLDEGLDPNAKMEALRDFRMEVAILKKLRHPNICMLLAYSTTSDYEVMVSELMKCSLLDVLKANSVHRTKLTYAQQCAYAQHIAQGMNYLHTCKPPIIHRDLKPANLLIDYTGTLKITDFGLAKVRPEPKAKGDENDGKVDTFTMTGETGTYRYMAPEVYRHERYTEKVDVYSYAMILFYLLAGSPPWPTLNGVLAVRAAAMEGRRPAIPRGWDERLSKLLQQCWDERAAARPGFGEILKVLNEYSEHVLGKEADTVVLASQDASCAPGKCVIS